MTTPRNPRGRTMPPRIPLQPGVYLLEVAHDCQCPTLDSGNMNDCTCTAIEEMLVRLSNGREVRSS
jgi:hypothetical protein